MSQTKGENGLTGQNLSNIPTTGGSTNSISGVGGMSPAEKVGYIQALQKMSPLSRIGDAVKKLKKSDFGLNKSWFDKQSQLFSGIKNTYYRIRGSKKSEINQHIAGLTENVGGVERIKHEIDSGINVGLVDGKKVDHDKGLYVGIDWAPKNKGQIE
jgi:hypothetical protein